MLAKGHGYSGKPLYQKLGLKPGIRCLVINSPEHYDDLIAGAEDVSFVGHDDMADYVHLFCRTSSDLVEGAEHALLRVREGGMLWVSWPKKSSALFQNLTEDELRAVILPLGWVDVKVCAVDGDWSGLKFLKRRV